jgi:hypothetical protein
MGDRASRLETVTRVMTIAMAVVVIAVGIRLIVAPLGPTPNVRVPFPPGHDLTGAGLLPLRSGSPMLLVGLSTRCQFCTASIPFYRSLIETPAITSGRVRVAVLSLQPVTEMQSYLEKHGLSIRTMVSLRDTTLMLPATPAIVVVGSDGRVVRSWQGQLDRDQERQVVESIGNLR